MRTLLCRADRYLIAQMAPRMFAALCVMLAALMIERLLRLLDFITGHGAGIGPVFGLILNLLPHYMGLALPAAFCVGILATLSSMAKANEIDALEAAGWSLRRIGVPFIGCAVLLALVSVFLFGVVQPYSRYAFNAQRHLIGAIGWDGRVEQGVFLDVGDGMTLSAAEIDASGRILYDVFLVLEEEEGRGETVITAERGIVVSADDGRSVYLVLENGRALPASGGTLDFEQLQIDRRFDADENPFRPRGDSERELTFPELWAEMHPPAGIMPEPRFAVEFHGRLVRALSLVGIALIAVPLSVARKRGGAWLRIAVAVAVLAAYDNLIKFAAGYAALGYVQPVPALWGAFAIFNGIGLWLYLSTPGQGSRSPLRALMRLLAGEPQAAKIVAAEEPRG